VANSYRPACCSDSHYSTSPFDLLFDLRSLVVAGVRCMCVSSHPFTAAVTWGIALLLVHCYLKNRYGAAWLFLAFSISLQ
jgi:hypothetical protein